MAGGAAAVEVEAEEFDPDDPQAAAKALRRWARNMKRSLAAMAAATKAGSSHGWAAGGPSKRMTDTKRIPRSVERLALLAQDASTPAARRTAESLAEQMQAFHAVGIESFEVQPMPPKGGSLPKQRIRTWDAAAAMRSVGWLRFMNGEGYDIFLRPAGRADGLAQPLCFIDDLSEEQARAIQAAGFSFTCLVESSPGNHHGWINLGGGPRPREEISAAAKILARDFGGDPSSADWKHYGRACGFTNRKASRAVNGLPPFARLRIHSTSPSPEGEALLIRARAELGAEDARRREQRRRAAYEQRVQILGGEQAMSDIVARFSAARARHRGSDTSDSAADFSAAMAMLGAGYTEEQVAAALLEARPALGEKHDVDDYIRRTVARAAERAGSRDGAQVYRPNPGGSVRVLGQ